MKWLIFLMMVNQKFYPLSTPSLPPSLPLSLPFWQVDRSEGEVKDTDLSFVKRLCFMIGTRSADQGILDFIWGFV